MDYRRTGNTRKMRNAILNKYYQNCKIDYIKRIKAWENEMKTHKKELSNPESFLQSTSNDKENEAIALKDLGPPQNSIIIPTFKYIPTHKKVMEMILKAAKKIQ